MMRSCLPSFSSERASCCCCWSVKYVLLAVALVLICSWSFLNSTILVSVRVILFSTVWMFVFRSSIWVFKASDFSWSCAILSRSCKHRGNQTKLSSRSVEDIDFQCRVNVFAACEQWHELAIAIIQISLVQNDKLTTNYRK